MKKIKKMGVRAETVRQMTGLKIARGGVNPVPDARLTATDPCDATISCYPPR